MTAAFENLKVALAASAAIQRQAGEYDAQAADLEYSAERDKAEAARIEQEAECAAADALLFGNAAPANGDRKAADLRRAAKTKRAAAEKARALATEVAAGHPAAQVAVTSATLGFSREFRDEARAELLIAFSGVVEPLAMIIAADLVRLHIIGERYSFDPREHDPSELWSGAVLVEKFVKGIPPRLRPKNFAETIRERAEEFAADIIRNVKEGQA